MIDFRRAVDYDKARVMEILKEVDIYYAALQFRDFWVAEENGEIVGCAQLEEYPDFLYLGSLAVTRKAAGKGVAGTIIKKLLGGSKKDTYIYTIIPDFFSKFGFSTVQPIKGLPSRERYECEDCHSDRCVCMMRPGGKRAARDDT